MVAPQEKGPFYGHQYIAQLSARFITHLFSCPPFPPRSTHSRAMLPYFIAYALHRTKHHSAFIYVALVLLQRLKSRFPAARGSSGHGLFISAYMLASKVSCDDSYSNRAWSIAAQRIYTLKQINEMEREMCKYLDWELIVDHPILANFEAMIQRDFPPNSKPPYPMYSLHMVSKRAAKATVSTFAPSIPGFDSTTTSVPSLSAPNAAAQQPQAMPTQTAPCYPLQPPLNTHPPLHTATPTERDQYSPLLVMSSSSSSQLLHIHPLLNGQPFSKVVPAIW